MSKIIGLNQIEKNLENYIKTRKTKVENVMKYEIAKDENEMKRLAPWTDRTGMARRALRGETEIKPNEVKGLLVHGMSYGKFLELCNFGKYRIIQPVWTKSYRQILSRIKEAW